MSKVDNISSTPVAKQVRNLPLSKQIASIPEAVLDEYRQAYSSGELSLAELQERWLAAGFMNRQYSSKVLRSAISKHGFKKREQKSHGFLTDHPEYLNTWDWEKNQEEGISPDRLKLRSKKVAWFKCPQGLHPSESREIRSHTRGYGCNKCGQQKMTEAASIARSIPKPGRSLLEMYPLVANEFDSAGNEISAKNIAARSSVVATFTPSCGNPLHRPYSQRVYDRTTNEDNWENAGHHGSWCPWCSNKKVSEFHGGVCEFLSSLIPLESGIDVLVNQMVLPDDPELPEGTRQGNELDFLSWDLKLGIEIHGYSHDRDPEGYTDSKAQRATELGLDFFVVWKRDWDDPEKRQFLMEQLRVIVGFKVMDYLKKQNRAVSGIFWNGDAA